MARKSTKQVVVETLMELRGEIESLDKSASDLKLNLRPIWRGGYSCARRDSADILTKKLAQLVVNL
jgi:hypothetical protein